MSTKKKLICPGCGEKIQLYKNPIPTVDVIIEFNRKIVLIDRKNIPHGWAIPGGFVDYAESVEDAAIREAKEETNLEVELIFLLGVYSDPERDPRMHTISTVFVGKGKGNLQAADDAKKAELFDETTLPSPVVFDHKKIIKDYFECRA
ncbi:MAG: NUDIX hydrolase [bacterium]